MLKAVITGANGFVGSHIVEELISKKYQVICIVRSSSNLSKISKFPLLYKYGNLTDKTFLQNCVQNADAVIHCAGTVRAFNKDGYFQSNVENTRNICEAVLKSNKELKKFIFISSQAAMGPSKTLQPRKLDEKEEPVSDYGLSKLAAEEVVKNTLGGKIPYTILRPASVYGPGDKDIFIFFNLVHKHLRPVTIEKRILQLVYVKDVAKSVISCIENKKTDDKTYYIAHKTSYTWAQVGKIIAKAAGRKTVPLPLPDFVFKFAGMAAQSFSLLTKKPAVLNKQKINEMLKERWTADTQPAETDLNIDFTKLEIGSKITYNWYLNNKYF
ncbi:MAG: NAD-dependent epimerase/dehydratase family protein [Endomicrobium sp.]|jgi:nucleoside-diphosphate-sugar epimerase|nr:NAD-dependent epimerase/dehydratase family protein [Endomicrobium sp.]